MCLYGIPDNLVDVLGLTGKRKKKELYNHNKFSVISLCLSQMTLDHLLIMCFVCLIDFGLFACLFVCLSVFS